MDILMETLDVYENDTVPVLASFSNDELDVLEDPDLKNIALVERRLRQSEWEQIFVMIQQHNTNNNFAIADDQTCLTPQLYRNCYAIVTSHCTIHGDPKNPKIVFNPMADMINHAPRVDNTRSFHSYHLLKPELSSSTSSSTTLSTLVVLADRDLKDLVWEEYNKLDNSIYILNFGFCPSDNPYHCVMLKLPTDDDSVEVPCVGHYATLPLKSSDATKNSDT
ncbi:hypothetical protein ACA910_016499 [Epithemia clementina (nom. ined.)]